MKTDPNTWADHMTIREYFAALAMQSVVVSERQRPLEDQLSIGGLAHEAVTAADALIAALNEEPKP